eukprot:3933816-Rhodomonas_salina.2
MSEVLLDAGVLSRDFSDGAGDGSDVVKVALYAIGVECHEDLNVVVPEGGHYMGRQPPEAPCVEDVEVFGRERTAAKPVEDRGKGRGVGLGSQVCCELNDGLELPIQRQPPHVCRREGREVVV